MNILFIGDIVGRPGRRAVKRFLPEQIKRHQVDLVVANAENIAGGTGATPALLRELRDDGIQLFTLGNHTWRKPEMVKGIDSLDDVARPANYAAAAPGKGCVVHRVGDDALVAVMNLVGRVYMEPADCPFARVEKELAALPKSVRVILVDMHAEATSEKAAMAWQLDGRATAVLGTHTHVQTADERILPRGTAFITDVGMCGPRDSILGVEKDLVIKKLTTGLPYKWEVAAGPVQFCAVVVKTDDKTGRALSIRRVFEWEEA